MAIFCLEFDKCLELAEIKGRRKASNVAKRPHYYPNEITEKRIVKCSLKVFDQRRPKKTKKIEKIRKSLNFY